MAEANRADAWWRHRWVRWLVGVANALVVFFVGLTSESWRHEHVVIFGVLLVVAAILALVQPWLAEQATAASEEALTAANRDLALAIGDLAAVADHGPPAGFLADWSTLLRDAIRYYEVIHRVAPVAPRLAEGLMQRLLQAVATLAEKYDAPSANARTAAKRFSANLMLHVPKGDGLVGWRSSFRFTAGSQDPCAHEHGALVLRPTLSSDTSGMRCNVPNLALLVPAQGAPADANGRNSALPGAPLAYARNICDSYNDVATLGTWVRRYSALGEPVAAEVDDYFKTQRGRMVGFLSIPVPSSGKPGTVIGVVNVDWSGVDRLHDPYTAQAFAAHVAPLLAMIAVLAERHRDALVAPPM